MRILLYRGGIMGELAAGALEGLPDVEVLYADKIAGEMVPDFDLLFSASYPGRINQFMCRRAMMGAVNIHTGLLPEGRGSNPLNWALIWGKDRTGITIHKIVDSYDAGDIVLQEEVPIFEHDTIVQLRERIEYRFPILINAFMQSPKSYIDFAVPQNQAMASYAQKRRPEDSELNLRAPDRDIYNLYRSCHPLEYPAFVKKDGKYFKAIDGHMLGGHFFFKLGDPYEPGARA